MGQRSLIHHTGWAYFPLAFVARLPFAMMVVGVLTLVTSATGTVGLGGLATGAAGLGLVVAGPVIGDLVDRFGQRVVLLPLALVGGVLLGMFPLVVSTNPPPGVILALAMSLGLTAPQAAALSRTRLMAIAAQHYRGAELARTTSRLMSYESAADETAFVVGPVLVGILATLVAPWAPIAAASALTLVVVTAFALHPSATVVPRSASLDALRAPARAVLSVPVLLVVGGSFGVGLVFGSTMTSLTGYAEAAGHGDIAGLLYGVMGAGSAVLALSVMFLPPAFRRAWRWLAFAAIMLVGAVGYAIAPSLAMVTVMVGVMGLGVGPTLVTLFSLAGDRSPEGRSATTMTLVGSAMMLAQSLSSALTGAWAEQAPEVARTAPLIAVGVVLAFGVVNLWWARREPR